MDPNALCAFGAVASLFAAAQAAGGYPVPPGPASRLVESAELLLNRTLFTGVPSDTWPSVWAADGTSYALGGDMPGHGQYQCNGTDGRPVSSFTNSFELSSTPGRPRLLNCQPVPNQEIYDVCSGGHPGSVFVAPNLKPVSMLALGDRILAVVQCVYEGNCRHNSDNPAACDDASYPACQLGINSWLISSTDGRVWTRLTPYDFFTGRLANPMFIGAGKAYAAAPDEWAYIHFPVSVGNGTERSCWYGNDYLLCARVARSVEAVTNRSAYEFWTGSGWSSDQAQAQPVFEYRQMIGAPHTFYVSRLGWRGLSRLAESWAQSLSAP